MPDTTLCRNANKCRHVLRPLGAVARDMEAASRAAAVELLGATPNVGVMEQRLRERLSSRTRRLLEELEGSCFACAHDRASMPTEAATAGAMPP